MKNTKIIFDTNVILPKKKIIENYIKNLNLSTNPILNKKLHGFDIWITETIYFEVASQLDIAKKKIIKSNFNKDIEKIMLEQNKRDYQFLKEDFNLIKLQDKDIANSWRKVVKSDCTSKQIKDKMIVEEIKMYSNNSNNDYIFVTNNVKDFPELNTSLKRLFENEYINRTNKKIIEIEKAFWEIYNEENEFEVGDHIIKESMLDNEVSLVFHLTDARSVSIKGTNFVTKNYDGTKIKNGDDKYVYLVKCEINFSIYVHGKDDEYLHQTYMYIKKDKNGRYIQTTKPE